MDRLKIDILNQAHREDARGFEYIFTKDFPSAYTKTALRAMQEYADQECSGFLGWVMRTGKFPKTEGDKVKILKQYKDEFNEES